MLRWNAGIIHYASSRNGNQGLQSAYSKQGTTLKLGNSKHEGWASIQLLTLCLNFLVYFAEVSSYFSMKTNKRKVRKCFNCMKEFLHKSDLANGKYLSILLGFFSKNCQGYTFCFTFTRDQLNNEGEGELREVKRGRDKTKKGKETIIVNKQEIIRVNKYQEIIRVNKYLLKSLAHEIVLRHEK